MKAEIESDSVLIARGYDYRYIGQFEAGRLCRPYRAVSFVGALSVEGKLVFEEPSLQLLQTTIKLMGLALVQRARTLYR